MDEYADIYYLDDTRNATRDHRPHGGTVVAGSSRPGVPVRPSRTLVVRPPAPAGGYPPPYAQQAPYYPPVPQSPMYYPPAPIAYGEPYGRGVGTFLGGMSIAQAVQIAVKAFAALKALPQAPNPTSETTTNTQNLIVYQQALAEHAKQDEQLRTFADIFATVAAT